MRVTHARMLSCAQTILLQQMTIEIDEDFIFSVIDFARFDGASWQNDKPS